MELFNAQDRRIKELEKENKKMKDVFEGIIDNLTYDGHMDLDDIYGMCKEVLND